MKITKHSVLDFCFRHGSVCWTDLTSWGWLYFSAASYLSKLKEQRLLNRNSNNGFILTEIGKKRLLYFNQNGCQQKNHGCLACLGKSLPLNTAA